MLSISWHGERCTMYALQSRSDHMCDITKMLPQFVKNRLFVTIYDMLIIVWILKYPYNVYLPESIQQAMAIDDIKSISIKEFLKKKGISPTRENSYSGMYISPLRQENTASFKVNYIQNLWYDYGLGKGGSIIDLVMAMQHCDFITVVKSLEEPGNIRIPVYQKGNNLPVPPSIEIKRIRPLADPRLLYYLRTRGIKPEIGIQHCREVYYKFSSEKLYYAIYYLLALVFVWLLIYNIKQFLQQVTK